MRRKYDMIYITICKNVRKKHPDFTSQQVAITANYAYRKRRKGQATSDRSVTT